jgi:hypothetical protein
MSKLALCVNPMSGRDVRRLAARATNMTHEAKRDIVARVAAGADAVGTTDIYITKEPFRIASMALEHMGLNANVHVLEHELTNSAADTERAIALFREAGCRTIVSLGGDGTNRAIVRESARAASDVDLVPLSTGTNNVFPVLAEPTVAGIVAGLNALGRLPETVKAPVKVLHVKTPGAVDVGLIDAVLLVNDHVGNLLPFDAHKLAQIYLARAEPNAIGMSPIGGYIEPIYAEDDAGLLVHVGEGGTVVRAPLSPGLFQDVPVRSATRVAFDVAVPFRGPGVIALDGDRDLKLRERENATVTLRRDGPRVIDIEAAMRWAQANGMMAPQIGLEKQ